MSSAARKELAQDRFLATCGVLLGVACALDEAAAIHQIADAIARNLILESGMNRRAFKPRCLGSHLVELKLLHARRLLDPLVINARSMVHPMTVALEFGSLQATQALFDRGFDPTRSALYVSAGPGFADDPTGNPHFIVNADDQRTTLVGEMSMRGINLHVSAAACILDEVDKVQRTRATTSLADRPMGGNDQLLAGWLLDQITGDEPFTEMLKMGLEKGLLDRVDPLTLSDALQKACEHGSAELLEAVLPRACDDDLYGPSGLMKQIIGSPSFMTGNTQYAHFCDRACELLLRLGKADLLLRPVHPDGLDRPIQFFVERQYAGAVQRCLEAGDDPLQKGDLNISPMAWAQRSGHEGLVHLMRSHLARREADSIVRDLAAPNAAGPRTLHL